MRFALMILLSILSAAPVLAASKQKPMVATELPVDRALSMTVLIPPQLNVLQEDQVRVYYLPIGSNYAVTQTQALLSGAALGLVQGVVSEGISLVKRANDRKRLALIEAAVGKHNWGERLQSELYASLKADGLAREFEFGTTIERVRVGSKTFDATGRALGLIEGHVAFTPNLRGLRIYVSCLIEDRRVIRNTQLRLEMERLPLRHIAVEYLIALPDDQGLRQKTRAQRWSEQDPAQFAAAIEHGISEAVRLVNVYIGKDDLDFLSEDKSRFRLDTGIRGKGRVLASSEDRVLIASKGEVLHSVPKELLQRGFFD